MQSRMSVIHEGVDTQAIRPNPKAVFTTESGKELRAGPEDRHLRGPQPRALPRLPHLHAGHPRIQRLHPDAEILIVGIGRGQLRPEAARGRQLQEAHAGRGGASTPRRCISPAISSRAQFRAAMHVSMAHIYLTYPFILSWSLVEAMASGLPDHRLEDRAGRGGHHRRPERAPDRFLRSHGPGRPGRRGAGAAPPTSSPCAMRPAGSPSRTSIFAPSACRGSSA